ncbi:LOW QUALITY PROTEIN: hypothetical protein OSB04_010922 [Centaurea solstitialis]|uniref:Pectinesterase n=1 Tax=Centaurea solstitialis TaxID=347529 RepID=A0AA38TG19_9ASTR|nr:LOW QUALITY PROTEIN: hypothetical protein OSB04_010922 [Centaurea solstitialis]
MALDAAKKKKITVIGMAVVLVVGAVVGSIVTVRRSRRGKKTAVLATTAVVIIICKYTDFRRVCEETLQKLGIGRIPRELMTVTFSAAVEGIQGAIESSFVVREAAKDPRAAKAVDMCKELLDCSIEDLKRSLDRENVVNLRVWLSGAVTYQETCLDAFENTTGDAGVRMRKLLEVANILTRNSLAMLDGVSILLENSPLRSDPRRVNPNIPGGKTITDTNTILPVPGKNVINGQEVDIQGQQVNIGNGQEAVVPVPRKKTILGVDYKADITIQHQQQQQTYTRAEIEGCLMTKVGIRTNFNWQKEPIVEIKTNEDKKSYPSWADTSRRSLIDADPKTLKPNAVVSQDGSGQFKTIMEAVNTAPQKKPEPFVILIKAGVYKENVLVPRQVNNVVFLGEGPENTKITGNLNYVDGVGTYQTATVAVNGDGFIAKDIWFENTAGPEKHQAVALRVSADMAIFHNCVMDAFQDTLYAHTYRQFYRQCTISGTIDFIFGDAAAVFQDCKLTVKQPMANQQCMVTAQGRKDRHSIGGLVFQGCTVAADPAANPPPKAFLGRPWKEFSRTVFMHSFIDQIIQPEGWSPWTGTFGQSTCYYAEFQNTGPGSNTAQRAKWLGVKRSINPIDAQRFTPGVYIQGDEWIPKSGVPYDSGLMKA